VFTYIIVCVHIHYYLKVECERGNMFWLGKLIFPISHSIFRFHHQKFYQNLIVSNVSIFNTLRCQINVPPLWDVPTGGYGGLKPPNIFEFARNLVKRQPCCKRVGISIFCDLLFSNNSWSIGQNILPPSDAVSAHHYPRLLFLGNWTFYKPLISFHFFVSTIHAQYSRQNRVPLYIF